MIVSFSEMISTETIQDLDKIETSIIIELIKMQELVKMTELLEDVKLLLIEIIELTILEEIERIEIVNSLIENRIQIRKSIK